MKKIFILVAALPLASDIEELRPKFDFLTNDYELHFFDPLAFLHLADDKNYYNLWHNEIQKQLKQFDVFIGISFGGAILQQCFDLFTNENKKIILMSTPGFANESLKQQLNNVIEHCRSGQVGNALSGLYQNVFSPFNPPEINYADYENDVAAKRMIFSMSQVVATDARRGLENTSLDYCHFIGEKSQLVTIENIALGKNGKLCVVPNAGMRMLEDNPTFTQHKIVEYLNYGH